MRKSRILPTLVLCMGMTWTLSAQKVSIKYENVKLEQALSEITAQTGYTFAYSRPTVDPNKIVSIQSSEEELISVLNRLFKGDNLSFEIKGKRVFISPASKSNQKSATLKQIKGVVVDENKEPIIGANVILKGSEKGTITDFDGLFSLELPENGAIEISYIGYLSQTINLNGESNLNIVLKENKKVLAEVVVTALGIKREEKSLGYAVQKVGGSTLETVKGVDVATSLTGKVAGLLVKNSTEFAAAPDIQIRGENPIIVIDGVPYENLTLRDIPSDDIEDISVLKGATASALYGYRGASGAIMVTTKRGSKGKVQVNLNSSTMFTAGYLAIPETQNVFGRVLNTATNTIVRTADGSWGIPMDGREVYQWDPTSKSMILSPYIAKGANNFENYLEQGYVINNNISISQQGEKGGFRSSATWIQNKGQYPNSKFDKITFSLGGDIKAGDFTISSNASYNKQTTPNKGFGGYTGYDPMYGLLIWGSNDYDIRDYKDYWTVPNEVQNSAFTAGINNPYFDRYERTHSLDRDVFNISVNMSQDFKFMKLSLRSGLDMFSDKQQITISKGSFQGAGSATLIPNGGEVWGESQKGQYNQGISRGYSLSNDLIATADQKLGEFQFEEMIGGSIFYSESEGIDARTQGGLSIPGFYSLKASVNSAAVYSNLYRRQVNSIYGRFAASWRSMLYAEATLRNDWSSTLSESARSYIYPSVSSSFVVSELLPQLNWLSIWKLRGSWTSSKTPAGIYSINQEYGVTNNAWGDLSSAAYPSTVRGTDVRPESAQTIEFGTMANFLSNRLSFDLSVYSKRMYDFLRSTEVSSASGFNSNYINIDEEITRKGVEIALNGSPIKTKDWQLDLGFNWSTYARYYTKLDKEFSADKPWVKVGERVDHFILRDYQRDPQGNIIHNNGTPLYSNYDTKFGNYDPNWIWGGNIAVKYKNWHLNVAIDGRVGGLAQTTTEMYMWRAGSHPNSVTDARFLDAATPGSKNYIGQGVKVISGSATYDTYGNILTDTRVYAPNDVAVTYKSYIEGMHKGTAWGGSPSPVDTYSTTFFKIREVALTYVLPTEWANKISSTGISASFIGQNLFLWAKQFKYSDPDGGSDNFSDPSQRYLGFSVKVGF